MKAELEITGFEETQRALAKAGGDFERHVGNALYQFCEEVMGASKEIFPWDTGNLASTGHVKHPKNEENGVVVEMGYGGTAANGQEVDYAFYVHEMLDPRPGGKPVNWTRPGSQSKYLETPLNERLPVVDQYLAIAIEDSLS